MQLTSEHLDQYIGLLEEADKAFVGAIQRDPIATAQADIFFQLGIRDKELMKWGLNQVNVVKGAYRTSTSNIIKRFQGGKIGFEKAFGLWQDSTKIAMDGMYRAGAATVGNPFYKDLPIPTRDKQLMARYLNREGKFWKGLLWDIKDPKHTSFIPKDAAGKRMPGYRYKQFSYAERAGMYPQSIEAVRYNGMIMGAGENVEIRWVKGAPQTETCVDCEALSLRMWTPQTLPTVPRAGGTKCLWKCYCHLEIKRKGRDSFFDAAGSATEGAMLAAGRYSQVFDTAGNAVGGVLQADIEMWSAEMNRARQMMTITRGKDRMFWIAERKRFNRLIIDRTAAGQYKSVPTVSVSALRKTILSAQAKGGSLVDDFLTLGMGDEVWFVRSDYSSFGIIGVRNGVRVFKSPTGIVLNVDAATDVMFMSKVGIARSSEVAKAAMEKCLAHANVTGNEYIVFIDKNGQIALEKAGSKDTIDITRSEMAAAHRGEVIIHSHPDGGSFSYGDIRSATDSWATKKIVVVEKQYTYELYFKRGKPLHDLQKNMSTIYGDYMELTRKYLDQYGKMEAYHKVIQDIAKKFDLIYKRTPTS